MPEDNFNGRNYVTHCPEQSWVLPYTRALYKIGVQIATTSIETSCQGYEVWRDSRSTMEDGRREAVAQGPVLALEAACRDNGEREILVDA